MISSALRLVWRAALAATSLLALAGTTLAAQESTPTGRIGGRILDAATGQGISDVGVQIVGTTLGAMSGVDGRYTITNIPAGTVTIQARRIGYQPKTVTGILLDADGALEQDITLESANLRLEAVTVSAAAERGSVSEALDQQRTATGIVNSVTQEQIQKSPDGDAAQAVQRVSGVTVQDGKYVAVRGLGERYTQTSLNGARLPSPEPEKRVVPLDIFPAGLLQTITTSKTFTPDLPGDFSGAQVDIRTREFPLRRTLTYNASIGFNSRATGKELLAAPTVGREWLGFGGAERSLPGALASSGDLGSIDQSQTNAIVRSFRDSWSPLEQPGSPNYSMGVALGGEDPVFGKRLGYLGSLTYSYNQEIQADQVRSQAGPTETEGVLRSLNRFEGETGRTSVLWGGLLNLTGFLSPTNRISLNNTYSRSADNEAVLDAGVSEEFATEFRRSSLRFVERTIRSNQLRGEHVVGTRHAIGWDVTSSAVSRDEPDHSEVLYGREPGTSAPFAWANYMQQGTKRIFAELDEQSLSGALDYKLGFGSAANESILKIGASARRTARDVAQQAYVIRGNGLSDVQLQQRPEELFGSAYTGAEDDVFRIAEATQGGEYDADETVTAGFAMIEQPFGDRVRLIAGARAERWDLEVRSQDSFGGDTRSTRALTDVLPAAAVNVKLSDAQNLRFSASRTLSRPDYREISPICYPGAQFETVVCGNGELRRALVENYDVRWEWYPNAGEVLSVGLFAKRFESPIERTIVLSTGRPQESFVNAGGADNFGVELEIRKGLGVLGEWLEPVSIFTNATLMESEIRLSDENRTAGLTNQERPMVGQAPYVVNGGLTWSALGGRASATVLYNVTGERVYSVGVAPLVDAYERPRSLLDLSLQFPLFGDVGAKLDARNLLDDPVEVEQGGVMLSTFRTGRSISMGLAWRP